MVRCYGSKTFLLCHPFSNKFVGRTHNTQMYNKSQRVALIKVGGFDSHLFGLIFAAWTSFTSHTQASTSEYGGCPEHMGNYWCSVKGISYTRTPGSSASLGGNQVRDLRRLPYLSSPVSFVQWGNSTYDLHAPTCSSNWFPLSAHLCHLQEGSTVHQPSFFLHVGLQHIVSSQHVSFCPYVSVSLLGAKIIT